MATEREYDASVSALLSGIVGDAQHLVRQEIALARQEIREEIAAAKEAGTALALAGAILGVGGLFLLVTLALGLADLLNWPAWAGFGIVGVVLGVVGAIMLSSARQRMQQITPVPERTVETMKENIEWIKDRTTSDKT
jgi:protein-S-isoprenylcysteine O-methyltransferase Ste14